MGTIFDLVYETGPFSEELARYYFKQLMEGLSYIHNNGFSHKNLQLEKLYLD